MTEGMVIVGAGEAGTRAAMALREAGFGGPVTLFGAEPHAPYERPPLSKDLMLGPADQPAKTIATLGQLAEMDIAFRRRTVVKAIDRTRRTVLDDDGETGYERLLIATGASPRHLSLGGAMMSHVFTLRTFDDAITLRHKLSPSLRVLIIGGGFIGLEFAAAAVGHGAHVTVLEALPRLLSRAVPDEIASRLEARHRAAGVEIIFDATPVKLEDGVRSVTVYLDNGTLVTADLVVVGIGTVPETGLAAAAGLAIANGVAVDTRLATSDPCIYAAGDCCSFPLDVYDGRRVRLESWRAAQDQGGLAAQNMLGANTEMSSVPWFWSDQYELTLQVAGLCDEAEQTVARRTAQSLVLFHLKADGRLVAASGIGTGSAVARDIRVAEMLIARRAAPNIALLTDAAVKPSVLLAG